MVRYLCKAVLAVVLVWQSFALAAAQDIAIPNFWDPQERFIRPNVKNMPRLRFLTTTDFPPFSYIDKDKRLAGFHVDLARAICTELELTKVCQIQALPFKNLAQALRTGKGEALLAGLAVTPRARQSMEFSRPYFRLPARFVTQNITRLAEPLIVQLTGKPVGVVDGTAHAAYARAHFGNMHVRLFTNQDAALAALEKNTVQAVFSDGLSLAFWLQSERGLACCGFAGDPYLSSEYFGYGLAVAVKKGNIELTNAIDYALRSISDRGVFAELYLRYFPISLF